MNDEPTIQFVQAGEPPLQAGKTYRLRVTQKVTECNAAGQPQPGGVDRHYIHERTVHVQGERFALDARDIVSMVPPGGSVGNYAGVLPSITFARRTLPWGRSAGIAKAPWLALLLFHASDAGGLPQAVPTTVGDLLHDSTLPTDERTKKRVIATYADAVRGWPGEAPGTPCTVVDVPVALFRALAPTQNDLPWLAHSRVVSDGARTSDYSAVLANRVPQVGENAAFLVSLEGLSGFLEPTPRLPSDATHVRLVVLKTWNFRHGETLQGFHRPLSTGPLRLPVVEREAQATALEDAIVQNALSMGYTALDHHTRWGDRTVSWYRGPLLPFSTQMRIGVPLPPICPEGYVSGTTPLSSADEALRYDPELGMLDVSYAAAWQLGRLLALRNQSFAYDLHAWKQENRRKIFAAAAAAERAAHTAPADAAMRASAPTAALTTDSAGELLGLLAAAIAPALARLTAPAEPAAPDRLATAAASAAAPRMDPKRSARKLLNDRARLQQHVDTDGAKAPPSVVSGLQKLRRLEGVPIDYLVPDVRMLPTDALRFFQVDLNWVYALVEGAYSVARVSALDQQQDAATCPHETYHQISGFLLRSALVSEWPDLQVLTDVSNTAARATTLRCERIAPDILFCLVEVEGPGVITSVTFQVPAEQLEFHLPRDATWRGGSTSVVDIHALAQGCATAADFAYKLSPPVTTPRLRWEDARDCMVLTFEATDALADQAEWQFIANGRPFGPPVPCRAASGRLEIALDDHLPAGTVAVRLRSVGAGPGAHPGRWITSTPLQRAPTGTPPVVGYRVAEGTVTAAWPHVGPGHHYAVQLLYSSLHSHAFTPVGTALRVAPGRPGRAHAHQPIEATQAVFAIGEDIETGWVKVRFRLASTAPDQLPAAWAMSTLEFRRSRAPTRGTGQSEGPSQLLFFNESGLDGYSDSGEMELIISAQPGNAAAPLYTAKARGARVLFDVPPQYLASGTYRFHVRIRGQDDQVISSKFFSGNVR